MHLLKSVIAEMGTGFVFLSSTVSNRRVRNLVVGCEIAFALEQEVLANITLFQNENMHCQLPSTAL